MSEVTLKPVQTKQINIRIKSLSPMIQHKWSEKAKEMMRQKHAGKKTKNREVREPEQECIDATYYTDDGEFGIPVDAIKASIIEAAHNDLGVPKTLVKKSLFVECDDKHRVVAIQIDDPPNLREDVVRLSGSSTDLRYRPEFKQWAAEIQITFDSGNLSVEDIINLINRAGFGVGIGEWRPERGGEFGRFAVDTEFGIQ